MSVRRKTSLLISSSAAWVFLSTAASAQNLPAVVQDAQAAPERPVLEGAIADPAPQSNEGGVLEEIVVTARRSEENLQRVPIAIQAFDQDDLEDKNVNSVRELSRLSSELQTSGRATQGGTLRNGGGDFYIRGLGEGSVVNYFAEVPNFFFDLYDLDNVQILAGPQGTLFGKNTASGAILAQPVRPSNRFEGFASIEGGTYSTINLKGAINIPIVPDRLAIRISGASLSRDGNTTEYQTGLGGNLYGQSVKVNNLDFASIRAQVLWEPFDGFETNTLYTYFTDSTNGPGQVLVGIRDGCSATPGITQVPGDGPGTPLCVSMSRIPTTAQMAAAGSNATNPTNLTWFQLLNNFYQLQQSVGPRVTFSDVSGAAQYAGQGVINTTSLKLPFDALGEITLKNIFSWQQSWTVSGGGFSQDSNPYPMNNAIPMPQPYCDNGPCRLSSLTEEIQIQGNSFENRLKWVAGFFYSKDILPSGFIVSNKTVAFNSPSANATRSAADSKAIFAQATYSILDDVRLTAGYRRTWDHNYSESLGNVNVVTGLAPATRVPTITDIKLPSADSYNLSADWQITPSTMVYAIHSTGYRAGAFLASRPSNIPAIQPPQKTTNYEIGAKTFLRWGDVGMRINGSAYIAKVSGLPVSLSAVDPLNGQIFSITAALGEALTKGGTITAALAMSNWFELETFATLFHGKYLEFPACTDFARINGLDCKGNIIPQAPELRYRIAPIVHLAPAFGLDQDRYDMTFAVGATHTSGVWVSGLNDISIAGPAYQGYSPPRWDVDASLTWDNPMGLENVTLAATVTNVLDVAKPVAFSTGTNTRGSTSASFTPPRMATLEARFRF